MTNDEKLMAQALEALARFNYDHHWGSSHRPNWFENSITALRDRLAQNLEMDEAIAAGDGTLHGAIDYWQERALKAEARLAQRIDPAEHDKTCAALLQGERYPCDCKPSAEPCVCGNSIKSNTEHRTDGPCYRKEPSAEPVKRKRK